MPGMLSNPQALETPLSLGECLHRLRARTTSGFSLRPQQPVIGSVTAHGFDIRRATLLEPGVRAVGTFEPTAGGTRVEVRIVLDRRLRQAILFQAALAAAMLILSVAVALIFSGPPSLTLGVVGLLYLLTSVPRAVALRRGLQRAPQEAEFLLGFLRSTLQATLALDRPKV